MCFMKILKNVKLGHWLGVHVTLHPGCSCSEVQNVVCWIHLDNSSADEVRASTQIGAVSARPSMHAALV